MKTRFLLLFFSICSYVSLQAQELMINGDMENWKSNEVEGQIVYDKVPVGYTTIALAVNIFKATAPAHSGNNCLQMWNDGTEASQHKRFGTPSATLAAGEYMASFWLKGKGTLRWVALTKDGVTPGGTSSGSGNYPGTGTFGALDFAEWTKNVVTFTIPEGDEGSYSVNFSYLNSAFDDKPFIMDDISLIVSPPVLKTLVAGESSIPKFNPLTFNYTLLLSSTHPDNEIPEISATSDAGSVNIIQATSITGSVSERTATVTLNEGNTSQDYTVTFEKSENYIGGVHKNTTATNPKYFGVVSQVYSQDVNSNHGTYWGDFGFRPLTASPTYTMTPPLANGAGEISFWMRKYSGPSSTISSTLQVQYKLGNEADWTTLESYPASSMTSAWVEKKVDLYVNDPTVQVRIYIDRTNEDRDFYWDDLVVTPWDNATSANNEINNDDKIKVYSLGHDICINSKAEKNNYTIYDIYGRFVSKGSFIAETVIPIRSGGIYLVVINNITAKVVVK